MTTNPPIITPNKSTKKNQKNKKTLACCLIAGGVFLAFIAISVIIFIFSFFKALPKNSPNQNVNLPNISLETQQPKTQTSQNYLISEKLSLENIGVSDSYLQTIFAAKFHNLAPYQTILEETISPIGYEIIKDNYQNEYLKYSFYNLPSGQTRNLNFQYKIKLDSVKFNLDNCQGQSIITDLAPEQYIESDNPEIINLAKNITKNSSNQCQASQAIYNWIGDNISYPQYFSYANGALWTLQNKQGDCTEFADLFIALNRAANIPARFVEGLVYSSDQETDPSKIKHDWAQVYLPNIGWVPVDPTFGRLPSERQNYFAALPATHATLTIGQNLETLHKNYFYYYEYNGSTIETTQENWQMQKTN